MSSCFNAAALFEFKERRFTIEDNFWNINVDFRNDNRWTVYMHTSPSGKRYVGITSRTVKQRWQNGRGYSKNDHFYRAIQKYGWDKFDHEIIAEHLTKDEACEMEKQLIKELNLTDNNHGYNICAGGEGVAGVPSSKFKDLTGNKYGRLTVVKRVFRDGVPETLWLCKCDCGKDHVAYASGLLNGSIKSCGCLWQDNKHNYVKTHGMSYKKIYRKYIQMKSSCYNRKDSNFHLRGAKGIKVCDEWLHSFDNFYGWAINNGYNDDLCLYRKNEKNDFCPNNCEWITRSKLRSLTNKRKTLIKYKNEIHSIKEWSDILDIPYSTLRNRIRRNKNFKTIEDILSKPYIKKGA